MLPGCGSPGVLARPSYSEPSTREARGDWNDLDAALEVGQLVAEVAVVGSSPPASDPRRFELVTGSDEPGWLVAQRPGTRGDDPGPIHMSARLGRFGDAPRERRLLDAIARRLEELSGVDSAPLGAWAKP